MRTSLAIIFLENQHILDNVESWSTQKHHLIHSFIPPSLHHWTQIFSTDIWAKITLNFSLQSACVFLHLILHYFLLTNYAWMLCEGFYLHTVLVSAFVSEKKLVRWLIVLGWTTPAVFLILYGVLRGFFSEQADRIQ